MTRRLRDRERTLPVLALLAKARHATASAIVALAARHRASRKYSRNRWNPGPQWTLALLVEGNRARQCIAGFCLREPGSYHAPGSSHLKLRDHISPWRLKKHASLAISPSQPIRSISALASASCQSFIPGLGNDPPPAVHMIVPGGGFSLDAKSMS